MAAVNPEMAQTSGTTPAQPAPQQGQAPAPGTGPAERPPHSYTVSQVPEPPSGAEPADVPPAERRPRPWTVSQVTAPPYHQLGNPGPMGLLSFALTTFVLGLYQGGAGLPDSNPHGTVGPDEAVFGLAVFMGGAAQFIAGVFEWRVGNTFGFTVHGSYGAFWLSYAMFLIPSLNIRGQYEGNMRAFTMAVGIYLILWCFLTLLFLIAALKKNIAILILFFFLFLAFLFLAIGRFLETEVQPQAIRVNKAGGAFAVVSAAAAFYCGASGLMIKENTYITLPLGKMPVAGGY